MVKIVTKEAPEAIGPYSQAIALDSLLFVSGQIPVDPTDGTIPVGIEAQAERSCLNVEAILKAAGSDMSKVVKTSCFIADINDFSTFNEVYAKYFVSKPARSCIVNSIT